MSSEDERPLPVYLDNAATTPLIDSVRAEVVQYLDVDFGNAGSRTHEFGSRAKRRVNLAREEVAALAGASPDEVIFTSGATEANNLALLGLVPALEEAGKRHVISTAIEHKAVLEPLERLARRGFDVELLPVGAAGAVDPAELAARLRPDTGLVSVMHVNNETGVIQPIGDIAEALSGHATYFHVDAVQGYGKVFGDLTAKRIDLMALSAHKIHGPKGVGALIARRRRFARPPLVPLVVGGGQERGLRAGTLPVHLIAGLGAAARAAAGERVERHEANERFGRTLLAELAPLDPEVNGENRVASTLNASFPSIDGEAAIVASKDLIAVSNGSACTSSSYEPSHVLVAMGLDDRRVGNAIRFSWNHLTPEPDWHALRMQLSPMVAGR